jgi:single-strand DNA-binding protein
MFKNHVDLIGFLGSDPETRQLENGAQLTSLSLATKTSWKNDAGSYDSRTEWHRIAVWGKLAQFAASLTKGAHIEVEGELRHRTSQKQVHAGKKTVAVDVTVAEIHATAVRKLDRNGSSANSAEDVSEEAPE